VWMVNVPVGSMSRSGLMGSWLKEMRGCVHGVGPGSGRMSGVAGTKPEMKALRAEGREGVSLMASWSCRQGANWTLCRRVSSCFYPRSY
jgi:hypothetical protein